MEKWQSVRDTESSIPISKSQPWRSWLKYLEFVTSTPASCSPERLCSSRVSSPVDPNLKNRYLCYGHNNKSDHLAGGRLVSPSCRTVLTAPCSSELPARISITKSDTCNLFSSHKARSISRDVYVPQLLVAHIHIMSCVCLTFTSERRKASLLYLGVGVFTISSLNQNK